jgi:hypothetical protein
VSSYVEFESDHAFTAFLSGLTPSRVLRDRSAMFSKPERARDRFLRAKSALERQQFREQEIFIAMQIANEKSPRKTA